MPRKPYKFRLLLDENMPLAKSLPRLNSRFSVKHVVTDFDLGGISDLDVYKLAVKEKRIIVTFNEKDFKHLAGESKNTGVIGVSTNLPTEQIDTKLLSLLSKSTKGRVYSKYNYISGETRAVD